MQKSKIIVYVTQTCPYCHAAKNLLTKKGYDFITIDVTGNDEKRRELVEKTGRTTVPQIFVDDVSIGGYDELVQYFNSGKSL